MGHRRVCRYGDCRHNIALEHHLAHSALGADGAKVTMSESESTARPTVQCQQCGGDMEKTVLANENTGVTAAAVILAVIGLGLLFFFPLGTIIGVVLLIAAPKIANRSKYVWRCTACGYFFERA